MAALSGRRVRVWGVVAAGTAAMGVVAALVALRATRRNEAEQLADLLRGPSAADAAWAFVRLKEHPGGEVEAALEPLKGSQEPSALKVIWHVSEDGTGQAMSTQQGYALGDVSRFILGARKMDRRARGQTEPGRTWRLWPADIVPPSRAAPLAHLLASRDAKGLIAMLNGGDEDEAEGWWALESLRAMDDANMDGVLEFVGSTASTSIRALAAGGTSTVTATSMTLGRVVRYLLWLRIDPADTQCWAITPVVDHYGVERTRRAWHAHRARPGSR